jgi:hypothetical protein
MLIHFNTNKNRPTKSVVQVFKRATEAPGPCDRNSNSSDLPSEAGTPSPGRGNVAMLSAVSAMEIQNGYVAVCV